MHGAAVEQSSSRKAEMKDFHLRTRLMHFDPCIADLVMGKAEVLVSVTFTPFGVLVQVPAADTLVNDGKERKFVLPIEGSASSKDVYLLQNCLHPAAVRGIIIKARKEFSPHLPEDWYEEGLKMLVIIEQKHPSPRSFRPSLFHKQESPTPPPVY